MEQKLERLKNNGLRKENKAAEQSRRIELNNRAEERKEETKGGGKE
jgi:hypothetical protein